MFNYPRGKGPKKHLNGNSVKKKRGRPKGAGVSPEVTVCAIRITAYVRDMLDIWKQEFHAKTYDDAIRAFSKSKAKATKKADALELELREQGVYATPNLVQELIKV